MSIMRNFDFEIYVHLFDYTVMSFTPTWLTFFRTEEIVVSACGLSFSTLLEAVNRPCVSVSSKRSKLFVSPTLKSSVCIYTMKWTNNTWVQEKIRVQISHGGALSNSQSDNNYTDRVKLGSNLWRYLLWLPIRLLVPLVLWGFHLYRYILHPLVTTQWQWDFRRS